MKKIAVLSLLLVFLTSFAFAGTVNLPRTGQSKCYDELGTEIDCAGTGQDGQIQAGVKWPSPRFTVNGDCVTDNLTGLMWAKNANLASQKMVWGSAILYIDELNRSEGLCDYHDRRLPNVNELESLVNANENEKNTATWLGTAGFINVQPYYWSSTSTPGTGELAWMIVISGMLGGYFKNSNYYYMWPVRAGLDGSVPAQIWKTGQTISYYPGDDGFWQRGVDWPSPRFTDHENGTITDNLTGLMWTKDANMPGKYQTTWQQALDYVKGMNDGTYENFGYNDWRLPNRKELHSLTDYSREDPALPADHLFINVQTDSYWSSTTYSNDMDNTWLFFMDTGNVVPWDKSDDNYPHYVWPVRAGLLQPLDCSTWSDVISKYNAYVSDGATWSDVINCYNESIVSQR